MESQLQSLSAFQIYSTGIKNEVSVMVDRLWIEQNRVFFRLVEEILPNKKFFSKERGTNIYSIKREDLLSIRCRLYF